MKFPSIILIFLFSGLTAFSQQKASVLILSNKEGKLLVDGSEQSAIKANEANKLTLEQGDHIIQIKTPDEILSKTVTCNDEKQKVITFEFKSDSQQENVKSDDNLISVADLQLDLPGSMAEKKFLHQFYSFDQGDEITFDLDILNKNGTVNAYLHSYPDNAVVYSRESVTQISGETIRIVKRGVYYFAFSTNHIVSRSAHFVVKRKPSSQASRYFRTTVHVKYDTSFQEVLNNQVRVYSTGNVGHSNRTIVRVNLPARTAYWVYWIGVDQESEDKMKIFADQLSHNAATLVADPLGALGMGLISSLPMFNSTATVDYRFADNPNSETFFNSGANYLYYSFKEGKNITTDYALEKSNLKELNFCLSNNNRLIGHNVRVRVVAFVITGRYLPDEGM